MYNHNNAGEGGMCYLSKIGSRAINVLLFIGISVLFLSESPQGKRVLNWLGDVSLQKASLGGNFLFRKESEREIIYLPMIPAGQLESAVQYLALNIYHEARGENMEGMVAVGWVTLNRVRSHRFPSTVPSVVQQGGEILYECQFSWWCDGRRDIPKEGRVWQLAQSVAKEVLQGKYFDNTSEALFYYNPKKASPCWGNASTFIRKIGNHKFFSDIPWEEMKRLCRSP